VSKTIDKIAFQTEIQNFLDKFCTKDRLIISKKAHEAMMTGHFYYVDMYNQGWYVLNNHNNLWREPTADEYYVYGQLWCDAVAYE